MADENKPAGEERNVDSSKAEGAAKKEERRKLREQKLHPQRKRKQPKRLPRRFRE